MKSLAWLVKVVDVGLVWSNHYKSKCLIFSKPFAWCLNSLFLSQQIKFSSHVLKSLKSFNLLFNPLLAQLLGTQQVVSWASLLIIGLTSSRVIHNVKSNKEQEVEEEKNGKRKQLQQIDLRVILQGAINFYNQLEHLNNDCPLNKEAKKYKMKKRILVETWSKLFFLLIQWWIGF